jgi:hypothetical protein
MKLESVEGAYFQTPDKIKTNRNVLDLDEFDETVYRRMALVQN